MNNPMQTHGAFSWMELHSSNGKTAKSFYTDLLGWNTEDMDMGEATYTVIVNGEDKIGGIPPFEAETARWLPYITVDDIDTCTMKAKELGATIISEPTTYPGVGRMATISDPVGGVVALITYETSES